MKRAKSAVLCGVSALTLAIGSAFAGDATHAQAYEAPQYSAPTASNYGESRTDGSALPDMSSASSGSSSAQGYEDSHVLMLEPQELTWYDVYDVDTNGDGVADSQLLLEQSDTTVMFIPSDENAETPYGG